MSLDSSQQANKIVQANNEVNCTWVLKYHKCFQLWIRVKWPRSYLLKVVRTSKILCWKIKVKTLREKIEKSFKEHYAFVLYMKSFWTV